MGFFDWFRRRANVDPPVSPKVQANMLVGAKDEEDQQNFQSFNNSSITFTGELSGYDYSNILRDKQGHIVDLYKLADYYTDSDSVVHGIIRHVYQPYTISTPWMLTDATEKTYKIYEDFYKKIRLREKLESIAYEYWKYGNVFVYIKDGVPITLPVHKCKIGNVALNGEPIVDFDCMSVLNEWRKKSYVIKENWIKDNELEPFFKGFPDEVVESMNHGNQYAQLNPKYTKVLQGPKESWQRYSIPFIASCLRALAKKELISKYEDSILNLGIRSFVHAKYGDEKAGQDMLPDINQLKQVRAIFSKAMSGFPLAVTNHLASAEVIQPDMNDLFQFDKYKDVNNDILSAGGVSGVIVSGVSEDGSTFASAQVSMQTVCARIEAARDEICELMNRINVCIQEHLEETHIYNVRKVPEFMFMPLDMSGRKALRDACMELWQNGVVSTQTMLKTQGYSIDQEKIQREREAADGYDATLISRDSVPRNSSGTNDDVGRPALTVEERTSDPDAALRGKQPKPSSPEGSMDDTEIAETIDGGVKIR